MHRYIPGNQHGWRLFLVAVALSPIVDGILRIRIGAAWEPSAVAALCLALYVLVGEERRLSIAFGVVLAAALSLVIASDVYGYLLYGRYLQLDALLVHQVGSVSARMLVESVRLVCAASMLLLALIYLGTQCRVLTALRVFLWAAIAEAAYGVYEFSMKVTGAIQFAPMLREKVERYVNTPRAYGTFYEPSQFGQFMIVSVLFYLVYLQLARAERYEMDALVRWRTALLIVLLAGLVVSVSRTAFVIAAAVVAGRILLGLLSLRTRQIAISFQWIAVVGVIGVFALICALYFVPSDFLNVWLFKAFLADASVADENTGVARVQGAIELLNVALGYLYTYPLGIGHGAAIAEYGSMPALFRMAIEGGVLTVAVGGVILAITFLRVASSPRRYVFLPAFIALMAIQVNYNTTNHLWIWFLLGVLIMATNAEHSPRPRALPAPEPARQRGYPLV